MTLAVVTRYFGGVKLGASGLVSAYSSCVASAIDNACVVEYKVSNTLEILIDYSLYKKAEAAILNCEGQITNIEYSDSVKILSIVPVDKSKDLEDKIIDISSGQAKIEIKNTKYNKFIEAKK